MKTIKLSLFLLVIAFVAIFNSANAQTFQQKLTAQFTDLFCPCYEAKLSGSYVLNFTYHLDNRTGKIDRIHFNIVQGDVWDSETGKRVKITDTGNDNYGYYWDFFNNLNGYNGVPGMYNVTDGWLDPYMPDVLPVEGTLIEMNFKFILKGGEKTGMSTLIQLHQNAKGQVTADVQKTWADCNE